MLEAGFTDIEGYPMIEVYNNYLDVNEKTRIEKLELFDEFEEWELIQNHYCLILASKWDKENELYNQFYGQLRIKPL